jgi:DNA-binding transcriptional LysR family regulator
MVDDYNLDFAVAVAYGTDASFVQRIISDDSIVAIVNRKSHFYKKKTIKLKELKGEPLILYPQASYSRKLIENCFHDHGITPTVAMEMHYPTAIISLVAQGMGIGLLSELSADQERLKGLRKISISELRGSRKIGLYYKKGRSLPPQTLELVDMIINNV